MVLESLEVKSHLVADFDERRVVEIDDFGELKFVLISRYAPSFPEFIPKITAHLEYGLDHPDAEGDGVSTGSARRLRNSGRQQRKQRHW